MASWFIGAIINELVYQAEDVMKRLPVEADDFGKDTWVAFLKREGCWDDRVCAASVIDAVWLDGGGCVRANEPTVSWKANGCTMKTYVRHLPFALDVLKELRAEDPNIAGCLGFRGFARIYLFSIQTRDEAILEMERLLKGTESLRQELEMDMQEMFNKNVHVFSARKCGCLSGKMYVDCCGKHVESPDHKDRRTDCIS